ncbi:UNVERIFIED_CONTAM: protein SHORT-ROOT [Sesamum radiatum]|uniref:Protein SHORT-ROOT n=1 Tax=Sesamum radiatum TaxID=300843 RepID=A0AAW2VTS2_SESRA
MDTLFRLVSLQADHSFNSSRTSSSSRSSRQNPNSYHQEDEECFNFYSMDHEEDFSSSSSSKHYNPSYHHHQQQVLSNTPTPTGSASTIHHGCDQSAEQFSFSPVDVEFAAALSGQKSQWASDILLETAKAIAENSARVQQLMWMLNEMSSPYGDVQKLASYFQGLFSRITDSGERTYRTMMSASEQTCSFESTRKMPTLLEAIATRADETPHLRITTVVAGGAAGGAAAVQKVMKEIGNRMEKFARLMGVPFKFNVVHHAGDLSQLNLAELEINEDEALAINCVGALHSVTAAGSRRDFLMSTFRSLQPRILTVVEEEADLDVGIDGFEFVRGFQECLRWFRVYFEALDESFPRTSNERLMLERAAGRAIVDLVACPSSESVERRETASRWSYRLHAAGFSPVPFSEEVCDDARSLLRRYKEGWSMAQCSDSAGIFLSWKGQPVVWSSAWRPRRSELP